MRISQALRKARGHKYTSKEPDGKGGFVYHYDTPGAAHTPAAAVPEHGAMLDTLVERVQRRLATGQPLQVGTMTHVFPLTTPTDIRRQGDGVQFRYGKNWHTLTDEQAERLAVAVGTMGPMTHAVAGGSRPAPQPAAPTARALFNDFQETMGELDQMLAGVKGSRAQALIAAVQQAHAGELDTIAHAYKIGGKKISVADAQAALAAARAVVEGARTFNELHLKEGVMGKVRDILSKSHKYTSREADGKGHYKYHYSGQAPTGTIRQRLSEHMDNVAMHAKQRHAWVDAEARKHEQSGNHDMAKKGRALAGKLHAHYKAAEEASRLARANHDMGAVSRSLRAQAAMARQDHERHGAPDESKDGDRAHEWGSHARHSQAALSSIAHHLENGTPEQHDHGLHKQVDSYLKGTKAKGGR